MRRVSSLVCQASLRSPSAAYLCALSNRSQSEMIFADFCPLALGVPAFVRHSTLSKRTRSSDSRSKPPSEQAVVTVPSISSIPFESVRRTQDSIPWAGPSASIASGSRALRSSSLRVPSSPNLRLNCWSRLIRLTCPLRSASATISASTDWASAASSRPSIALKPGIRLASAGKPASSDWQKL